MVNCCQLRSFVNNLDPDQADKMLEELIVINMTMNGNVYYPVARNRVKFSSKCSLLNIKSFPI